MADPLDDLLAEHADLEQRLADPAVHADQTVARELGRRYAEIGPVVAAANERDALRGDLQAARELEMAGKSGALEPGTSEQLVALHEDWDAASRALRTWAAEDGAG